MALSRAQRGWLLSTALSLILLIGCGDRRSSGGATPPAPDRVAKPLPPDAAPPDRQVYRYLAFEPVGLDFSMTAYQSLGSEFVFERLCMLDHNLELVPGAAERWETSPDGKTWTFHLRPGGRWSDGAPVTAHDFEYTYKRLLDPNGGNVYAFFYYDIKGAKAYNQRKNASPTSVGVRAVDDLTFVIETEKSCAYLPYLTQYPTSSPVPRWQVEKYGPRWTEAGKCVSNSAFQLEEWTTGKQMTFGLNPYYHGPNPARLRKVVRMFTGFVGAVSAAGGVGLLPYENNEADLITVTSPVDLERIMQDPCLNKELWTYDGFATQYLFFQTRRPPFNDLKVRRAIVHAIDKDTIARVILRDTGIPAYTMLPPHFPGYVGGTYQSIQRYDPALAKRLFTEAGYPGGKGFPATELWLSDAAPTSPVGQVAQFLQQRLREVLGIQITIRNEQGKTYLQRMYNWEIPLAIGGFGYDFPDPQSLLGIPWHSQPRGYGRHDWTSPAFDALIDQAAGELDPQKRPRLYDEAERILAADVGAAFLWHTRVYELRKPWVKGLKPDRWGNYPFRANVSTAYYELYIGNEVDTVNMAH
ncbi:MAG: peptide ABC transporter substrate-binding protein [Candidatus Latescibacteria bacterium]|nr:peptide ABC transporter substrate-binding protein [Candidatus Latescibacterota bacterium]